MIYLGHWNFQLHFRCNLKYEYSFTVNWTIDFRSSSLARPTRKAILFCTSHIWTNIICLFLWDCSKYFAAHQKQDEWYISNQLGEGRDLPTTFLYCGIQIVSTINQIKCDIWNHFVLHENRNKSSVAMEKAYIINQI